MEYGRFQFDMGELIDGVPKRIHEQRRADQGDLDALVAIIEAPKAPAHGEHVWVYFWELRARVQPNQAGVSPISRKEIRQWQEDRHVELQDWERQAILALDDAFISETNAQMRRALNDAPKSTGERKTITEISSA